MNRAAVVTLILKVMLSLLPTRRFIRARALPVCLALLGASAATAATASAQRIEVSFPSSLRATPVTGHIILVVARDSAPEPRFRAGGYGGTQPFFGLDVSGLAPGVAAVIDASTPAYPISLARFPAGDYYVQAVLNVYTEFHRADGHVIWAHMDQWEGQQWNRSPGNLVSDVHRVHVDPRTPLDMKISFTRVLPPVTVPPDTKWVKHIKIQSKLLSAFWGHPMFIGATILLPRDYDSHPAAHYPTIYQQDHFSLAPAFGFAPDSEPNYAAQRTMLRQRTDGREPGFDFYKSWTSNDFPRMIAVKFQHPTPYYDDSYAVNSANNGPYADALLTELVPYIEAHVRAIPEPYARVLTGGSTGGWESIALQVLHPDFFNGTWTFYPDPVDFRSLQMVDAYSDTSAFAPNGNGWVITPRYMSRTSQGQTETTQRDLSKIESVLGSHERSGQQFNAWDAAWGPAGTDGYPRPLWNKTTGTIDPMVAAYWRDHDFDLRDYLAKNWATEGPKLTGKLHVYVGDMDNYYLNLAVYQLNTFLENTTAPRSDAVFQYGRPMKGHGWQPMSDAELVRMMAKHVTEAAPRTADVTSWKY
ncbi:MAG TPA: alpha/beta hydrolase-fold protein [Gemmatimonadaceae bacterium]